MFSRRGWAGSLRLQVNSFFGVSPARLRAGSACGNPRGVSNLGGARLSGRDTESPG